MSIDAGGLAHMTYNHHHNNSNVNGFPSASLSNAAAGFRASRLNSKRLSVALPPKVASINEDHADLPTPRTSRSHLLAGLRTQPKSQAVPASAPYHQTHHSTQSFAYGGYGSAMPQTATAANFDLSAQYAANASRQMYVLPEQVLAPPSVYDAAEEMDPAVLQQMQLTSFLLAQRQQQLQQQLANITAGAGGLSLGGGLQRSQFQQNHMSPHVTHNFFQQQQQQQQQLQSPVDGQPGLYLVYNPATQNYSYAFDQSAQYHQQPQQQHQILSPLSPSQQTQGVNYPPAAYEPTVSQNGPTVLPERSAPTSSRSITPPKKAPSPPSTLTHVEPLPPPSATAFRRGHKKASSLAIHPSTSSIDGPKTSSTATFGSQRNVFPPTPMTGTFGPGAARVGEHPTRQPRGPPPLEELVAAPTSSHEGSKNFATRQRRRALDDLVARTNRRGVSRSSSGSPVSEHGSNFSVADDVEDIVSLTSGGTSSRKMSPIGSEMKEKRNSRGSNDGYFGLSSASSSEGEEIGIFKQPLTPATPGMLNGERKKMMIGVLNAAEKRKSIAL